MNRSVYRVHLGHEGPELLATVEGLLGASTFGRDIYELETSVREVVVLAANRPMAPSTPSSWGGCRSRRSRNASLRACGWRTGSPVPLWWSVISTD